MRETFITATQVLQITGTKGRVLAVMQQLHDANGRCWAGYASLAARAKTSRGRVIVCIKQLVAAKIIDKTKRADDDGRDRSNLYVLAGEYRRAAARLGGLTTSREGRKDSEPIADIESTSARPVADFTPRKSLAPLLAHNPSRAKQGWMSMLGQFAAERLSRDVANTVWRLAMDYPAADAKRFLNKIDAQMRASDWYRQRRAAVDRYWLTGRAPI